ncbi:MAG: cell division protein FtsZ [Paludibacter sp.]|nr:cell division protein FtsZ [Paludibacter sp.]
MSIIDEKLPLELPLVDTSIIKVIGVGGGGGNAVNHMYQQGIKDVSFVVCNTDNQALDKSPVPLKIQLGVNKTAGLGAGGIPDVARQAAEESIEEIQKIFDDNTKMVFITAGMGGGTGTGASPVVAKVAHDLGILTVGIVTIPFAFEGILKIKQALEGIAALSQHVDAILVINNEKLKEIYPDLELSNAFAKADDVLTNAAKGIAEIITIPGYINTDFADVYSIMKDGKVAIMNTGYASGEKRIANAIEDALNSPLLNTTDVNGAGKVLLSLYCSTTHQIKMEEVQQIHDFMAKVGDNVQVIWGATFDDSLEDKVKITIIATGYGVSNIPGMPDSALNGNKQNQNNHHTLTALQSVVSAIKSSGTAKSAEEDQMNKVIAQYYGKPTQKKSTSSIEIETNDLDVTLDEINLDELEDEPTLKKVESTPSWRRFMK